MASKKQQDALKAKQKRQKVIAIGGAVLLLALLAFQVPRTMKMLNAKAPTPPPPAAAPTTVPTDPSVLPTPGAVGGGAAPTASGGGTLVDSDVAPTASTGQLIVFGQFASKDPFNQQIDPRALQAGGGAPATPAKPGETPAEPVPDGGDADGGGGGVVTPTPGDDGPSVPAGSAQIAVNGVEEVVAKGASFPKDAPMFTLVAVTRGEAKVAVAGGAFASGARTITLSEGKAVTLVNTADGTRYELELVAAGA